MGAIQRFIENYRDLVRGHSSHLALPLSVVAAIVAVALSYLLIYRSSSPKAKRRASVILSALTIIALSFTSYELWYWGEMSFDSTINIVPIAFMDAIAAFKFYKQPRGILQAVLFAVFLLASLAYAASTVLSELIPVNRLEVNGLLAREIVQPGVVADGSRLQEGYRSMGRGEGEYQGARKRARG